MGVAPKVSPSSFEIRDSHNEIIGAKGLDGSEYRLIPGQNASAPGARYFQSDAQGKEFDHKQYVRNSETGEFRVVEGRGGMKPMPKTLPKTGPNTEDSPKSRERRSALPDQPAPRKRANQVPVSPVEGAPVSKVSNKPELVEVSENMLMAKDSDGTVLWYEDTTMKLKYYLAEGYETGNSASRFEAYSFDGDKLHKVKDGKFYVF